MDKNQIRDLTAGLNAMVSVVMENPDASFVRRRFFDIAIENEEYQMIITICKKGSSTSIDDHMRVGSDAVFSEKVKK